MRVILNVPLFRVGIVGIGARWGCAGWLGEWFVAGGCREGLKDPPLQGFFIFVFCAGLRLLGFDCPALWDRQNSQWFIALNYHYVNNKMMLAREISLEFRVFGLGLLEDGNIRVGVFPEG
jgi:hypothetical protein